MNAEKLRIFDRDPTDWQDLEAMVAQAFAEMGYVTNRRHKLATVRGSIEIDVHAVKTSTPLPTVVLCECKYWSRAVSQDVIHAFRSVCSDAGAHFGIIISSVGFQSGAEASRHATNVHLLDFASFQETFFREWQSGAMMMLSRMRNQILPLLRAQFGFQENGLDIVSSEKLEGLDPFNKYSMLLGYDGKYSDYFILEGTFPSQINDPRGNPYEIRKTCVTSHRHYLEIALAATREATEYFALPEIHYQFER